MASRGVIVVDVTGLVIVRVEHGVADSFSRSVMPTAARAWKRAINRGAATQYRVAELAPDFTVNGRECASFVAFGPTFASTRASLDTYIEGQANAVA